ncbi:DUF763 domain-containing protein [Candidatus Peregrinibacteria bacterium]|nr:DUF763 domain-containing protein [Candidatus Peregrinibacteria bacterium]
MRYGIATFTLDNGKCPKWLFERMTSLGREILRVIVMESGPDQFIKMIADPVWFQSLGTVLAFDWNASGLTTILTAALKEAIRGQEREMGIFICGGKGKTSLKTPDEIKSWVEKGVIGASRGRSLVYNSKMSAKVDSCLVQDGYDIYHHSFFFSKNGSWAVVQQGMNTGDLTARRYHWFSDNIKEMVCEPHSGVVSDATVAALNMAARSSDSTRNISTELVQRNFGGLMKDIALLSKYASPVSSMARFKIHKDQLTLLKLEDTEFKTLPVVKENFYSSNYLKKILWKLCDEKPENYENLLAHSGVGPKTIRALALTAEVIYGAKPSYEDPSRYSFAHGGKDGTPYFVDRKTYDKTIDVMKKYVSKMRINPSESKKINKNLDASAKPRSH